MVQYIRGIQRRRWRKTAAKAWARQMKQGRRSRMFRRIGAIGLAAGAGIVLALAAAEGIRFQRFVQVHSLAPGEEGVEFRAGGLRLRIQNGELSLFQVEEYPASGESLESD